MAWKNSGVSVMSMEVGAVSVERSAPDPLLERNNALERPSMVSINCVLASVSRVEDAACCQPGWRSLVLWSLGCSGGGSASPVASCDPWWLEAFAFE